PAADHVTAPSFTRRASVGIVPPFNESCPKPSSTNRMTYSVALDVAASREAGSAAKLTRSVPARQKIVSIPHRMAKIFDSEDLSGWLTTIPCQREVCTLTREFLGRQGSQSLPGRVWHPSDMNAMLSQLSKVDDHSWRVTPGTER